MQTGDNVQRQEKLGQIHSIYQVVGRWRGILGNRPLVHLMRIRSIEKGFPRQGKGALKWPRSTQATEPASNYELQAILRQVTLVLKDTTSVSG